MRKFNVWKHKFFAKIINSRMKWVGELYLRVQKSLMMLGVRNSLACIMLDLSAKPNEKISKNLDKLDTVSKMLQDEKSRHIFNEYIRKRKSFCTKYRDLMEKENNWYVIGELKLGKNGLETIVDAGAYNGDTVELFLQHLSASDCSETRAPVSAGGKIYAFEADPNIYAKLCENVAAMNTDYEVIPICKAVFDQNTTLRFEGKRMGKITACGSTQVEAVRLDDEIQECVTFIKMDIEGAELAALKGAEGILRRDKPKLAICIYHKPQDLWEIPMYLKEIVPEYKFYVRHHSKIYADLVLYVTV